MTLTRCEHTFHAGKESAVSEVIGSVLLISIVVIAVSIVGVVLWSQPPPEEIPALSAGIANQSCKVTVFHTGGDTLENATFSILVDGNDQTANFNKGGTSGSWTSWGIGETLVYDPVTCAQPPGRVQIVYTGGNGALLLSSAYFGTQPSGTGTVTPTPTITPGPTPTVTSITPNSGARGWPVTITNLAGTNFESGATVKLVNNTAGPDVAAYDVFVVSPTMITCKFNLLGVTAGRWNVTVTNPSSAQGVLQNGFTVNSPAPTITGNSVPATGIQGQLVTITNLPGTNYQPGALVDYYQGSIRINLTNVNVVSTTQMSGTLQIPADVPTSAYDVSVKNSDDKSGTRVSVFTVNSNAPTVTSRSNATMYRFFWPGYERIIGTNFVSGAQSVINTTTGNSISSTSCEFRSSTELFCRYNLLGAPLSPPSYRVAVINPDGKSGLMTTNLVAVSNPPNPTVTSIIPNTGQRGTTVTITNISGTNFQPSATVLFSTNTAGTANVMSLTNVNVESITKISGTLVIPAGQSINTYYVRVTNTDATTGRSSSRIFSVTA